ncbi:uncharacterized protein PHACADRAFT_259116 [Phanerochaete carnosa HHB-10118-sp]|uniref:Uncharacterized protein n=1 Tax=Phanerochaete carnosa (strain HHB-10118-sp) TaxID=650164 RepID=K5WRE8_PHACS|nr:uncharacterized protein PHACADRAFT_259116 [Phanerochaete carnosa HHB-10118-sp]EKM52952.1 hypothetical protein PHACADRAFT_259116 [Phanerochaete carnosa HHB-10118-sp]
MDSSFRRLYDNEVSAYAYLLHHGACAKEVVPICFGRVTLTTSQVAQILTMCSLSDAMRTTLRRADAYGALLLEHISDGQHFTIENITNDLTSRALQALYEVHTSFVCHGALGCRNVLFLERELPPVIVDPSRTLAPGMSWTAIRNERERRKIRIVWLNFANASCPATTSNFPRNGLAMRRPLRHRWHCCTVISHHEV